MMLSAGANKKGGPTGGTNYQAWSGTRSNWGDNPFNQYQTQMSGLLGQIGGNLAGANPFGPGGRGFSQWGVNDRYINPGSSWLGGHMNTLQEGRTAQTRSAISDMARSIAPQLRASRGFTTGGANPFLTNMRDVQSQTASQAGGNYAQDYKDLLGMGAGLYGNELGALGSLFSAQSGLGSSLAAALASMTNSEAGWQTGMAGMEQAARDADINWARTGASAEARLAAEEERKRRMFEGDLGRQRYQDYMGNVQGNTALSQMLASQDLGQRLKHATVGMPMSAVGMTIPGEIQTKAKDWADYLSKYLA